MTVTKWTLTDATDATSHTFAINPCDKTGPAGEMDFEAGVGDAYVDANGPMVVVTQDKQLVSKFEVTTFTADEYRTFWAWFRKGDELVLSDDLGRVSTIYMTDIESKRTRKPFDPWFHELTVSYLVLDVVDV